MRLVLLLLTILAVDGQMRLPVRMALDDSLLHIAFESGELSATTNGATVTPTRSTCSTGVLHVAGTGSVNFAPMVVNDGAQFLLGNQQNTNTAYYKWSGASVGNCWPTETGEIRFFLKSSYSFAERIALGQTIRYAYHVYDDDGTEQAKFFTYIFDSIPDRLKLVWFYGEYDLPVGEENTLFGDGVTLAVRITWDGTNHSPAQGVAKLYLNDVLTQTVFYTYFTSNFAGSNAVAIIGAQAGGFEGTWALDDRMDDLIVRGGS